MLKFARRKIGDIVRRSLRLALGTNYVLSEQRVPSYLVAKAYKKYDLNHDIPEFSALAREIMADRRTFLQADRLHTLWQGVAAIREPAAVVEIGTYLGGSARFLHLALRKLGKTNPVLVCDTFKSFTEVDPSVDGAHKVGESFVTSAEEVREYLSDCDGVSVFEGDITQTASTLPATSFALVHIDVDVYPATKFCLEYFGARLAPGGIMICDDYGFTSCKGAFAAVEEFVTENPAFTRFHLLTGQALIVRIA